MRGPWQVMGGGGKDPRIQKDPEVFGQIARRQFQSPLPSWVRLGTLLLSPSLGSEPPPRCGAWLDSPLATSSALWVFVLGCPRLSTMSYLVSLSPHQRKAQITCTAIFIVWGVLVHLVIPPLVFMVTEEWDYIEGFYYSFTTISTIGFGDFVAGESCLLPLPLLPLLLRSQFI